MSASTWLIAAAVNGLLSVAAGAFGAHALKHRLDTVALNAFETAARYQMYHALALLGVAWLTQVAPSRVTSAAGAFFLAGIILFSGSLYGLSLLQWKWLGPVTPLGGVCLMLGWFMLIFAASNLPGNQ